MALENKDVVMEKQIKEEAFEEVGIFAAVPPHLADYDGFTWLTLVFGGLGINDAEAAELAAALPQLQQLTKLWLGLDRNSIGDAGAAELAAGLEQLQQLKELELILSENSIGDAGAVALAEAVRRLPHLQWVRVLLRSNNLGAEGAAAWNQLQEELRSCCRGSVIVIIDLGSDSVVTKDVRDRYYVVTNMRGRGGIKRW